MSFGLGCIGVGSQGISGGRSDRRRSCYSVMIYNADEVEKIKKEKEAKKAEREARKADREARKAGKLIEVKQSDKVETVQAVEVLQEIKAVEEEEIERLTPRQLLELRTCPQCGEKVAPLGDDTIVFNRQSYHWYELLKGEHRLNGHKKIYAKLKKYRLYLEEQEELDPTQQYELLKLREITFIN
jgi:hypothetical protein